MAKGKKKKVSARTRVSAPATRSAQCPADATHRELDDLLAAVRSDPRDLAAALKLADHYNSRDWDTRLVELLQPFESDYPFPDRLQRGMYNRLLGLAYARLKRFTDAEKAAERGLQELPDAGDFLFVLCYAQYSLCDYDKAIATGRQLAAILDKAPDRSDGLPQSCTASVRRSQFYNILASAFTEKKETARAIDYFQLAIRLDPGSQLPYLNLAKVLRFGGNVAHAQAVIKEGLARCRQVQELRLMEEEMARRATVSACMMVKNEEELLPGCLDTIRSWVDEIVVVDTGSTDRTVEIAQAYGAKVFHQSWANDFSLHRNYSMQQATCDWILIIDADERVYEEDVPILLGLINGDQYGVLSLNVYNVYGANDKKVTFLNSVRVFKRSLNLKYEGIVHNALRIPPDETTLRTRVRIKHLGYGLSEEKMRQKFARTKALLRVQLDENPDNTFALYNYAQLLLGEGIGGDWKEYAPEIIRASGRAIELTSPDDARQRPTHLMCLNQVAWAHFYVGEYDKAIEICERALAAKPDFLDPILLLGHAWARKSAYETSDDWYHRYLKTQSRFDGTTDADSLILFHPASRTDAYYGLASNAEAREDTEAARGHYLKIVELNRGYLDANAHLGRICLGENNCDEAEKYFLDQLEYSEPNLLAALGLAYVYLRKKDDRQFLHYHRMSLELASQQGHAALLVKSGRTYLKADKVNEAVEVIEKARLLGSDDDSLEALLADACFRAGRYDRAIEAYERALVQHDSPEILNDLGNCYYQLGRLEAAAECYRKVLGAETVPPMTYRNFGLTMGRLRNPQEAITALEKYLELEPQETEIAHILGDLYATAAAYPEAISRYEKYLLQRPDDVRALFSVSECYLHMGHKDSAIIGYQRVLQLDDNFRPARERLESLVDRPVKV